MYFLTLSLVLRENVPILPKLGDFLKESHSREGKLLIMEKIYLHRRNSTNMPNSRTFHRILWNLNSLPFSPNFQDFAIRTTFLSYPEAKFQFFPNFSNNFPSSLLLRSFSS
jgi:hypothetical protein